MAERISVLEKEADELQKRKANLLLSERSKNNETAEQIANELLWIAKKEKELCDRIDLELNRRDKIDKICIPILLIGILFFITTAIITIIKWIYLGNFPTIVGIFSGCGLLFTILVVVVMKILNPDMRIF